MSRSSSPIDKPARHQPVRSDSPSARPKFAPVEGGRATGTGRQVNLVVPTSAYRIEVACVQVARPHGRRWPGLMNFWLEGRLMAQLVPGR